MNQSELISGPFCKVEFIQTNINSPVQLKDFLLSQGWEPTSWTAPTKLNPKGSPQITEDSFHTIKGDMGKLLAERAVLKHRLGMLFSVSNNGEMKGWINTVRDDSRLEAGGVPNATNTRRYRHGGVVNVPKAKKKIPYGPEIRSLFIAKQGYKLMGVDAKQLEANMEAHYCYTMPGGKEYAESIIAGDAHSKNAVIFEIASDPLNIQDHERDAAKSPKYCLLYGGAAHKLTITLGRTPPEGCTTECWKCKITKKCKGYEFWNGFWDGNIALKTLRDRAQKVWEQRGFLISLDGGKVFPRSKKDCVNTLFQSAGSIVVKTATCYMANWVKEKGLDARQVIHYHDEFTYEFHPKHEEEICELAKQAFKKAGEFWQLNVPIEGDPKVGMNWKEIH